MIKIIFDNGNYITHYNKDGSFVPNVGDTIDYKNRVYEVIHRTILLDSHDIVITVR